MGIARDQPVCPVSLGFAFFHDHAGIPAARVESARSLNGYLNSVINEAKQTKTSPDAVHVEHVQMPADHVIISATNIQEWLATVNQDALDILAGHHNADQGQEVAHLTDVALNGQDLDNDRNGL